MSSVYLMKNMDNGYYKLGFSDRPEYRERTLQAQEPDVRLLATVSGTKELEQKLQLGFAKHRVRGEWFSFSGLALSSIAEVFGVSVEMIDPPSETFDVQYCVAHIHRYAGPQYSTRLLEKCTKEAYSKFPMFFRLPRHRSNSTPKEERGTSSYSGRAIIYGQHFA